MNHAYTVSNGTLTLSLGDKTHTLSKTSPYYNAVLNALVAESWDKVADILARSTRILTPITTLAGKAQASIVIGGEKLELRTDQANLFTKALEEAKVAGDINRFTLFLSYLTNNPKGPSIANELYSFMLKNECTIAPNGLIQAWKGVTRVYKSPFTDKVQYSLNKMFRMERTKVDANPANPYSYGLHVGNKSYNFGDIVTKVYIHPADVVCVPTLNSGAIRVCRFLMLDAGQPYNDSQFTQYYDNIEIDQLCKMGSQPVYQDSFAIGKTTAPKARLTQAVTQHAKASQATSLSAARDITATKSVVKTVPNKSLVQPKAAKHVPVKPTPRPQATVQNLKVQPPKKIQQVLAPKTPQPKLSTALPSKTPKGWTQAHTTAWSLLPLAPRRHDELHRISQQPRVIYEDLVNWGYALADTTGRTKYSRK